MSAFVTGAKSPAGAGAVSGAMESNSGALQRWRRLLTHDKDTCARGKSKVHKYMIIIKKNVSKSDTEQSPSMFFFIGSPAMLTRIVHNHVVEISESDKPRTKSFLRCDDWQLSRIKKQTSWRQGGGSSVLFLVKKLAANAPVNTPKCLREYKSMDRRSHVCASQLEF